MAGRDKIGWWVTLASALVWAAALGLGCDSSSGDTGSGSGDGGGYYDDGTGGGSNGFGGDYGDYDGEPSGGASADPNDDNYEPPPEVEIEIDNDLRRPALADTLLYIPSAGLDSLVVVDAAALRVDLVDVGDEPVQVKALPGDDGAVVLNTGTSDVTIVRVTDPGEYTTTTVDVLTRHNRLLVTDDGDWAFAWYKATGLPGDLPGSLQDVSVIRLTEGEETIYNLSVGLRPASVIVASGRAVVVCDNGLSIVDLDTLDSDAFLPPVPYHEDPFVLPTDREVVVTPDGTYAVVRDLDRAVLTLVELESGTRKVLSLPDWPSDLDMTADGALVVVPFKNSESVAILEVPAAFDFEPDPEATLAEGFHANPAVERMPTWHPFGVVELATQGDRGLLYTTEEGILAVGQIDLVTRLVTSRPIAKEVISAVVAPSGATAVLLHRALSGLQAPESTSEGYSVMDLGSQYAKLVLTNYAPTEVAFSPEGDDAYVLLPAAESSGGPHAIHRMHDFALTSVPVPAPPVFIGLMPDAERVVVLLDDPTGWLTVIHVETGAVEQLNSFELNSRIQ